MEKLSVETLQKIFILLDQQQKVQCMLTCQQWEKIISNSCLLETVRVSTLGGLSKLKTKLEGAPNQRTQVNRLIIVIPYFEYFDDVKCVIRLLPNIKMLYIHPYLRDCPGVDIGHQPFANTIEHLVESKSMDFISQLLEHNTCPNLKTLSFDPFNMPMELMVKTLAAAPNLTKLTLQRFTTTVEDLEELHNVLPKLTHLEFQEVELLHGWPEDPGLPTKIKKAPLVESITFTFHNLTLPEFQTKWFKYMNKKYPNLKACHFGYLGDSMVGPSVESEMSKKKYQNPGIIPFFKKHNTRLESFSYRSRYVFADLFGLMDKGSCQVQNMRFSANWFSPTVPYFLMSDQSKHVERLTLDHAEIPKFEFLKSIPCLKELVIYGKPGKSAITHLNGLLDSAPESLVSLTLDTAKIECDATAKCYPLKALSITRSSVPEHLDVFLNQSLQQLSSLKFDSVYFRKKTVDLSNINLTYLEYRTYFQNRSSMHLMVHTLKDDDKRCWSASHSFEEAEYCGDYNKYEDTFSKYDAGAYPHMLSFPYDPSKHEPPLTFVCASLNKVLVLAPLYS